MLEKGMQKNMTNVPKWSQNGGRNLEKGDTKRGPKIDHEKVAKKCDFRLRAEPCRMPQGTTIQQDPPDRIHPVSKQTKEDNLLR